MQFIINNWYIIVAAVAVLAAGGAVIVRFAKVPSAEQLAKVREWLLWATTVAEKELGSGTGKLKLRYVYDLFVTKFPWVAKVLPFTAFSELVDESLDQTKEMLTNNAAVQLFVNGPAAEDNTAEG